MRALLVGVGIGLMILAVCAVGFQFAVAAHNSCRYTAQPPKGALTTEANSGVLEYRSWWPIGEVCEWPVAVWSDETVQSYTGSYGSTVATYGLAVVGAAAAVTGVVLRRRPRETSLA